MIDGRGHNRCSASWATSPQTRAICLTEQLYLARSAFANLILWYVSRFLRFPVPNNCKLISIRFCLISWMGMDSLEMSPPRISTSSSRVWHMKKKNPLLLLKILSTMFTATYSPGKINPSIIAGLVPAGSVLVLSIFLKLVILSSVEDTLSYFGLAQFPDFLKYSGALDQG